MTSSQIFPLFELEQATKVFGLQPSMLLFANYEQVYLQQDTRSGQGQVRLIWFEQNTERPLARKASSEIILWPTHPSKWACVIKHKICPISSKGIFFLVKSLLPQDAQRRQNFLRMSVNFVSPKRSHKWRITEKVKRYEEMLGSLQGTNPPPPYYRECTTFCAKTPAKESLIYCPAWACSECTKYFLSSLFSF